MIIELPKDFSLYKSKERYAVVKDDCLYIKGVINFEALMYSLTYAKKGKTKCYYCFESVSKENITLDHTFPQCHGGVSITNNLLPSCSKCNSRKGNFNFQEYLIFQSIGNSEERWKFKKSIADKNEKIRYRIGYNLPKKWVKNISPEEVFLRMFIKEEDYKAGAKYKKYMDFIKTYNHMPKPIVISSNKVLLDGYITFMCAIENGYTKIPAICLENVIVVI